ncbi:type 4 pilus major pilin [Castellaniella sp.]|uniref:type 4 pilus major pilin n=1 Tax=Castellaniella sp. TaxID=1955812 RepID=UPI003A8D597C
MKIRRKLKGFTLIELLIVLGIIAVISAGMYAVYNNVSLSQKSSQEINNLNILKGGIENLFAASSDYTGLSEGIIAQSSIPTATMMKSTSTGSGPTTNAVVNAWGNSYKIAPDASPANFTIETDVPKKACEKIVSALAGTWSGIDIDGTSIKERGQANYNTVTMITTCSGAANDTVKITVYDNDSK